MDDDLSEVTFDDLGWDSFFPCHPEKGVDLSRIYQSHPEKGVDLSRIYQSRELRSGQEEDAEQTSSEDEAVDVTTRALPLTSYLVPEADGARDVSAAAEDRQWHHSDEGNIDDFEWDNYVPARLGRYNPTYAFVLTHGHTGLDYDRNAPFYDSGKQFPVYGTSAPVNNRVAPSTNSRNCYIYENFDGEKGRDTPRTVNPQYLMFPPPEDLYQSCNKTAAFTNNRSLQNPRIYQAGKKHSFASNSKNRFNDFKSQKYVARHVGSKTVYNSNFGVSDKVRPESSSRLKSREDPISKWTKTSRTKLSCADSSASRQGQETNKENRNNRPEEILVSEQNSRTTKGPQNAPPEGKRRRVRRFFLGYMKTIDSLEAIKEAIYSHAREQGVELTYVRMMKNERQGVVFARVNVAIEQANLVTKENFWPADMIFRPWLSKAKYKEQGGTKMPHIEEEHSLEVSC